MYYISLLLMSSCRYQHRWLPWLPWRQVKKFLLYAVCHSPLGHQRLFRTNSMYVSVTRNKVLHGFKVGAVEQFSRPKRCTNYWHASLRGINCEGRAVHRTFLQCDSGLGSRPRDLPVPAEYVLGVWHTPCWKEKHRPHRSTHWLGMMI